MGEVESPAALEAGSVSACPGPLELWAIPQLTRWKVERCIHVAVNGPSLDAVIRVTERCCRRHEEWKNDGYSNYVSSLALMRCRSAGAQG
jgi:hypothetical protein